MTSVQKSPNKLCQGIQEEDWRNLDRSLCGGSNRLTQVDAVFASDAREGFL